jgi:hypothetical protein
MTWSPAFDDRAIGIGVRAMAGLPAARLQSAGTAYVAGRTRPDS